MFIRTCLACVVALAALACESDYVEPDGPVAQKRAALTHQVDRQTSNGETIRVAVPDPAPTVEVPEGGACGIQNEQGAYLSCQPGTFCLSKKEGAAGTCQATPRTQRLDEDR